MKLIKENTLDECLEGMIRHRSREAYAIIGQGLWLIKAQAINSLPPADRKQGRKPSANVALVSEEGANPGFDQWLEDHVCGPENPLHLSRRTCYNYIRAAAAVGLTADSDEEDLAAMEAANILGDRKISDLYKAPPTLENGSNVQHTPPSKPEDYWDGFDAPILRQFAPESQSVMALYQLPEPQLDSLENTIRTALDVIKEVKAARASNQPKRR